MVQHDPLVQEMAKEEEDEKAQSLATADDEDATGSWIFQHCLLEPGVSLHRGGMELLGVPQMVEEQFMEK